MPWHIKHITKPASCSTYRQKPGIGAEFRLPAAELVHPRQARDIQGKAPALAPHVEGTGDVAVPSQGTGGRAARLAGIISNRIRHTLVTAQMPVTSKAPKPGAHSRCLVTPSYRSPFPTPAVQELGCKCSTP